MDAKSPSELPEVGSLLVIFVSDEPPPLPSEPPLSEDTEGTEFEVSVGVGVYETGTGAWVPEAEIAYKQAAFMPYADRTYSGQGISARAIPSRRISVLS
jgi:hypothetical protein